MQLIRRLREIDELTADVYDLCLRGQIRTVKTLSIKLFVVDSFLDRRRPSQKWMESSEIICVRPSLIFYL